MSEENRERGEVSGFEIQRQMIELDRVRSINKLAKQAEKILNSQETLSKEVREYIADSKSHLIVQVREYLKQYPEMEDNFSD